MESRPGSSKDDPSKPRAKKSRLCIDSNLSGKNSIARQNSPGLFHRVSNTFSGLLSNVSWSDWMNSSNIKSGGDSENCAKKLEKNLPGALYGQQLGSNESQKYKETLNPLYPEEGVVDVNKSNIESRVLEAPKSESSCYSPEMDFSFFAKTQPVLSSTPSLGFFPGNKSRKNIRIDGNGLNPIPSTSGVCNGSSIYLDNTLGILRKSLYDGLDDSPISKLNGTLPTTASKKRLRDQNILEEPQEIIVENSLHTISPLATSDVPQKKRPRFSISSFGSPLYGKQDLLYNKQDLNDSSLSVFYPGKVMYGGAFNHSKLSTRLTNRKITPRANVTSNVSSDNKFEDGGLSTAAKRILNCIDNISTPLSNSKRVYFSKQRDPESPSYIADFHKHRPSLKSNGDVSSPPVAKLLTPGKARVSQVIPSLIEKKSMLSNKESFATISNKEPLEKVEEYPSITFPRFSSTTTEKNNPIHSVDFSSSSTLNKSPVVHVPVTGTLEARKISINKNSSELIPTIPTQSLMKPSLSSSNLISDSIADFSKNEKHVPTVKNNCFTFSMPIPFAVPSTISNESSNLEAGKFTFRNPIEVDGAFDSAASSVNKKALVDMFRPPPGTWECSICLLQNNESSVCCIACNGENLNLSKSTANPIIPQPSFLQNANWGEAFLPPKGAWDCSVCLVQNQGSATKCVACESARSTSPDRNKNKDKAVSTNVSSSLAAFLAPSGTWECEVCLVQNMDSVDKCAACTNPKSSSGKVSSWGEKFKPSKDTWDCDVCLLQNSVGASTCVACQAPRPGKGDDGLSQTNLFAFSRNSSPLEKNNDKSISSFKFGCDSSISNSMPCQTDLMKSQEEWQCETCLVRNKHTSNKCTSCESPKSKLSTSTLVSEALTGNFKFSSGSNTDNPVPVSAGGLFGASSVQNSNGTSAFSCKATEEVANKDLLFKTTVKPTGTTAFTFGLKKACEPEVNPSFKPSSNDSTFNFSVKPNSILPSADSTNKEIKSSSTATFTFGATTSEKSVPLFSFGVGLGANVIKDQDTVNVNSKNSDIKLSETINKTVKENFIQSEKQNEVFLSNKKDSVNNSINSGTSNINRQSLELKQADHNNKEESIKLNEVNPTFSFGNIAKPGEDSSQISSTKTASEKLFTFGNPPKKDDLPVSAPIFSFNSVQSKTTTEASTTGPTFEAPKFTFSQNLNADNEKLPPPSLFSFGESNPKPLNATFSFGNTSSLSKDTPKFGFGNSGSTAAAFTFGQSADIEKPQPSAPFSFGGNQSVKSGFSFGADSTTNFSFGKPAESTNGASNLFQFRNQKETGFAPTNTPEPSFGSLDSNPFNVLTAPAVASTKRVIKRAVRRNK